MKEILQQYASYNLWANERLLNLVLTQDESLHKQVVPGSFPTLYATFLHIWDVESIWWQRIKLQEHIVLPSESSNPDMKEVAEGLLSQSKQWETWVQVQQKLRSSMCSHTITAKKNILKILYG